MLVEQYRANLQPYSRSGTRPVTECPVASDPYGPVVIDTPPGDYPRHPYACSAGGAAGGLPIVLAALVLGVRRRRRQRL